jgi:hypothetical protein
MTDHTCQEVEMMIGDKPIQCGAPAETLVRLRGRDEGPYWLCEMHAFHYIKNRNCEDITPKDDKK